MGTKLDDARSYTILPNLTQARTTVPRTIRSLTEVTHSAAKRHSHTARAATPTTAPDLAIPERRRTRRRPPPGLTVGGLLITASPGCMCCVGLHGMSARGARSSDKTLVPRALLRISAGHRRFYGVELRGFEPRAFSLRRRVPTLGHRSMRCMSCAPTARAPLVSVRRGAPGGHADRPLVGERGHRRSSTFEPCVPLKAAFAHVEPSRTGTSMT